MDTNDIRAKVIDKLSSLHHLPFYVHFLIIEIGKPCKFPDDLPEFETCTLKAVGEAFHLRLKDGMEWRDALLEASREKVGPGALPLTPNARALLDWLQVPGNSPASIKVNTLGRKAGFKGPRSYNRWDDYCREINLKTGYHVLTNPEHGSWGDAVIELTLGEKSEDDVSDAIHPPNPCFAYDTTTITKEACDAFTKMVENIVIEYENPKPGNGLLIYDLSTHSALAKVWPETLHAREVSGFELERFLENVRLAPCLNLVWSIPFHADRWLVGCRPTDGLDWDTARRKLVEWRAFKGSLAIYGLSENTSLVLDWLLSLRPDEFVQRLSPPVSTAWEDEIGLESEYDGTVRGMLLEAMADEINEFTLYEVRVISSKNASHHQSDCRLLFKRKPTREDLLVRQIRHYLMDHATLTSEDEIRKWLNGLIRDHPNQS